MKAAQVVGSHDPDEVNSGAMLAQIGDGLVGVARADLRLAPEHRNPGMAGELAGSDNTRLKGRKAAGVLERIARGDEPPDAVEAQPLHGNEAGGEMRIVGGIEGAAGGADGHAPGCTR